MAEAEPSDPPSSNGLKDDGDSNMHTIGLEETSEVRLHTVELNSNDTTPEMKRVEEPKLDSSNSAPTPIPKSYTEAVKHANQPPPVVPQSLEGTQLQGRSQSRSTGAAIKDWSVFQYKVTKQMISERLGKSLKTVDSNVEERLEAIRDTQKKYQQMVSLCGQLQFHIQKVVETQKCLAEHFAFLSVRCPELDTEFEFNSETQKKIARNGETLAHSLKFFTSNVYTLSSKSIEDTLTTARLYETARILYDAYRSDLEAITKAAKTSQAAANKVPLVQNQYENQKEQFERLRRDMDIKLKLLDENRFKVMQRQLVLLHSAFAAYFSGNHVVMETLIKEFQEKLEAKRSQRTETPSWLEDLEDTPTSN